MTRPSLAFALLPALVAGLGGAVVGCAPADPGDTDDDDDVPACDVGRFVATSIAFEEAGCLDDVGRDGTTLSASAPGLSWEVFAFDAAGFEDGTFEPGTVLDDGNSSTTARYEREGLEWVVFAGAIGGTPQGEGTLTLDAVDDATWRGRVDGVAVPGGNNDSLDSVFVTIIVE
jgi:hypothetical protein